MKTKKSKLKAKRYKKKVCFTKGFRRWKKDWRSLESITLVNATMQLQQAKLPFCKKVT